MHFVQRLYREQMNSKRFKPFIVTHFETDLWIGVDHQSYHNEMPVFCKNLTIALRKQLEKYISLNPFFRNSLSPLPFDNSAPPVAKEMIVQSQNAGVGPMATVAGAFSQFIGNGLISKFAPNELVVENGGDIYLFIKDELKLSVFAGNSVLSGKIGIQLTPEDNPMGICTSSSTVGPSLSLGKSDATMIICKNAALADGYASFYGNMALSPESIDPVIGKIKSNPDILSAIVVIGDRFGICGRYKMQLFR